MSVIVKGVKMPTTCTMCWLNTFCGAWNTEPVKHKGFNERLENCPLTELIRCKDCEDCTETKLYDGQRWNYCMRLRCVVKENDFCCWAERKYPKIKAKVTE